MRIMDKINELRKRYVVNQVKNIKMPNFPSTAIARKNIIFAGKVQKVGFRLEIYELSKRLNLTGWVKNLSNGTVEAEIQGEEDKIIFLIEFMKSLKRATVKRVEISNLEVMEDEMRFTLIKGK